jgi:hypothetical protein
LLCDEDVVQVVAKTLVQQKASKDYSARVRSVFGVRFHE